MHSENWYFEDLLWNGPGVDVKRLYFNSLWPSDVIWQHRSRSTLIQVMACCLTVPSHFLSRCVILIGEVLWHSCVSDFALFCTMNLIIIPLKFLSHLPGANELMTSQE